MAAKKPSMSAREAIRLAEEVAGRAAERATHEKFEADAREESRPRKSGMKPVRTKA